MVASAATLTTTVVRGVSGVFVLRAAGLVLALVAQILWARILGAYQFGLYTYALAWLQVALVVGVFGFDTVMVRFVASYQSEGRWDKVRGLLKIATMRAIAMSLLVSAVGGAIVWSIAVKLGAAQAHALWVACLILPICALSLVFQSTLRGLKYVAKAELPDAVFRPAFLIVGAIVLYTWVDNVSATHALAVYVIAVAAVFFFVSRWVKQSVSIRSPAKVDYSEKTAWLSMAAPILGIALLSVLLSRLDVLMLGAIKGPAEAGIYSAVSRVAELTALALAAVNGFIAPRIAELYRCGREKELQQMLTTTARLIAAFTVSAATILVFGGESLLAWYGEEFIVGGDALLILVMGQVINALAGSVGLIMVMTGHQKQAAYIMLCSTCLNLLLNLSLIPAWGMVGAATATSATLILWNGMMVFYVAKVLKINPTCLSKTVSDY